MPEITESATANLPSGNLLGLLTIRQALLVLGRCARITVTDLAPALGITRDTAHRDLREARAAFQRVLAGPEAGGQVHVDSRACRLCGSEARLPGRLVGRACEARWQRVARRAVGPRRRRG